MTGPFICLTDVNGLPVWVNVPRIACFCPRLGDPEHGTSIFTAPGTLDVKQTAEEVLEAIREGKFLG